VRGTIASTGARLLKGTARKLTEQFWNAFGEKVYEVTVTQFPVRSAN
jgi:carbon monoxide dehydrogenase subunit G